MATIDMQEQEELDALKAWWKDNHKWLLGVAAALAAGFLVVFAWKYYQGKQAAEASTLFAEVLKQVSSNDVKKINDSVQVLVDKYGSTAYASRAQLMAVQANIQYRDLDRAKKQLEWVISNASENGLRDTARLKLASMLLDEQKLDESLKLLDATHPDSFTGLYSDLKGDVLAAQGKNAEARAAYKAALDKMDSKSSYRTLIQLKLDGLGAAPQGDAPKGDTK